MRIIRRLFTGEQVGHHGRHYTVQKARLYTLPDEPVPIDVSAFGPQAAELAGRIGDGFVTREPVREPIERFRRSGGGAKPASAELKVCWGPNRAEAVRTARRLWPNEQLPGELPQVLPTPRHFEQTGQLVTAEQTAHGVPYGDDADAHVAAIKEYVDAGFDPVYVNRSGPASRAPSTSTARVCCRG